MNVIGFFVFIINIFFRLFVNPLYCGVLLEQSLMFNRRRTDEEYKSTVEKVSEPHLIPSKISKLKGKEKPTSQTMFFFSSLSHHLASGVQFFSSDTIKLIRTQHGMTISQSILLRN